MKKLLYFCLMTGLSLSAFSATTSDRPAGKLNKDLSLGFQKNVSAIWETCTITETVYQTITYACQGGSPAFMATLSATKTYTSIYSCQDAQYNADNIARAALGSAVNAQLAKWASSCP